MSRRGENIHKRKDGRWEARYIKHHDDDGKAKYASVYGKSYLEVKQKLRTIFQSNTDSHQMSDNCVYFKEVLFLWLENNRISLKPQTYAKYLYMIEHHIIGSIGNYDVASINSITVNQIIIEKFQTGRLDGNGGLSVSYIRTISFIVLAALEFATVQGYRAPFVGNVTKPKEQKKELPILSGKEQQILENFLYQNIDERKLGILISLYTGLRIGEICGLRWLDIDFENKTMHIRHTSKAVLDAKLSCSDITYLFLLF